MDDVDRAKVLEMQFRALALANALRRPEQEPPLVINGVVCCRDCREPIPLRRLEARPESVRCVPCKTIREGRRG